MKIAVCVAHYGDVRAKFAYSLRRLVIHSLTAPALGPTGKLRPEIEVFFRSSSTLPQARNDVVEAALKWDAEWLLLLDADHEFPPDALFRLLARGKPVIGCNYEARSGEGPVIPYGAGVQEVGYLGLGVFLVHRDAFKAIAAKALSEGQSSAFPLFMLALNESRSGYIGEDIYFCHKLRGAGFPVFCDHDLSREIGHVAERTLTLNGGSADNADSVRTEPPAGT
jgi:glycosyltransferase involved in cell wall biosynthesis